MCMYIYRKIKQKVTYTYTYNSIINRPIPACSLSGKSVIY